MEQFFILNANVNRCPGMIFIVFNNRFFKLGRHKGGKISLLVILCVAYCTAQK